MGLIQELKDVEATLKVIRAFQSCETLDQWRSCLNWYEAIKKNKTIHLDIFDIARIFAGLKLR